MYFPLNGHYEIAPFLSIQWELKFSNGYNSLNIALVPHKLISDLDVLDLPEQLSRDEPP